MSKKIGAVEEIGLIEEMLHALIQLTFIEHLQHAGITLSTLRVIRMDLFIIYSLTSSHILNTYYLPDTMLNAWDREMKHSPSLQESMGSTILKIPTMDQTQTKGFMYMIFSILITTCSLIDRRRK